MYLYNRLKFATIFLVLFFVFSVRGISAQSNESGLLFEDAVARIPVNVPDETIQSRTVRVNLDMLGGDAGPSLAADGQGQTLHLNLFDDVSVVAQLDQINQNAEESYSWIGDVSGDPLSEAIFVVKDRVMVGLVIAEKRVFEIRYVGDGVHLILEVDQSQFIEHPPNWEEAATAHSENLPSTSTDRNAMAADDGSIIDIMVGYTVDARNGAGGTTAIQNTAQLAVDATNQSYENSNITQRLYLVHTEEFVYTETGNSSTDLSNWRNTSDGNMDNAHTLRNTYHADLMMLLTENGGGFCGIASLQTSISASFESSAFGVTARGCAVGNLSFAHEVGHNLGLRHDWYVDTNTTPFSYSHGFSNVPDTWRTVMAYNNHCDCSDEITPCPASASRSTPDSPSCTRLTNFSNPTVLRGGDPMGVSSGTSTSCSLGSLIPDPSSCDADSASVINFGDTTYAQWRASQITWVGNTTDWNDASNWTIDLGVPGSTTATARVPLTIDDVVIPSSPTGGNFPTISSGAITAREVVIETGATLNMTGGTLTVTGMRWEEQGTGQFNATGGTVIFDSVFDQTVTTNPASTFPSVQFGNGSTQNVTLANDVDIDGNLTIANGAKLVGSSQTINLLGNWADAGSNFDSGTGSVIFDGTTQSVNGSTTVTLLNETFSAYDSLGANYFTTSYPTGWVNENNGTGYDWRITATQWGDEPNPDGDGHLYRRWDNGTNDSDVWLFTSALSLVADATYTLNFNYGTLFSSSSEDFEVTVGTAQSATPAPTQLQAYTGVASTAGVNETLVFTVPSDGTYYIGFHSTTQNVGSGDGLFLDDISLIQSLAYGFNNLEVASGTTTFAVDVVTSGNLQTASGAIVDFGADDPTVEGTVTNNGTIRQTKDVSGVGTLVEFGRIQNAASTTNKYYGVDITPTSAAFGETTVDIKGNGKCTVSAGTVINTIDRCFEITPTNNSQPATVRFYYNESELDGQTYNNLQIWHWNGMGWDGPIGTPTYGDSTNSDANWNWIEASGVNSYSPFAVGNAAPTVVVLEYFTATANVDGSVTINWKTTQETNHAGFNILRRPTNSRDAWSQVNDGLIASVGTQGQGASYQFSDTVVSAGTWDYLLEDVETDGDTFRHLDFVQSVDVQEPTNVSLSNSSTAAPSTLLFIFLITGLLITTRYLVTAKKS